MPPTKETLEATANTTALSPVDSSVKGPDRMRADAVSLELPVRVHGTRVGAAAGTASSEPFEEKTSTMIVFPQGGVLRMATFVAPAQMIVITNLKSGHDAICRVKKVRAFAQGQSYVEIEFTHQKPGYWGVYFPGEGPQAGQEAAPANSTPAIAPPISVEFKVEKTAEQTAIQSTAVKPIPKPPVSETPEKKQGSVFAQIGSQEEVQPPAAATSLRTIAVPALDSTNKSLGLESAIKSPSLDLAVAQSPSIDKLQNKADTLSFAGTEVPHEAIGDPQSEDARPAGKSSSPLGLLATARGSEGDQAAAREPFGGGFGSSTFGLGGEETETNHGKRSRRTVIGIAAAAVLALAAGAAYHFQFGGQSVGQTDSSPAPAAPTISEQTPQAPSNASAQVTRAEEARGPRVAGATPARINAAASESATLSKPLSEAAASHAEASVVPTEKPAAQTTNLLAALKVHPKARKHVRGSANADAPDIEDTSSLDGGAALGSITGTPAVAPPPEEQESPVRIRVGGALKPPQLISSVLPIYPAMARETGIEGDVVIDTTIDKTGKVTGTKVISGTAILRQAALDALRQWKYQPSLLNGEPVPVQMTVTIKFHHY
jgi:protein TonB